MKKVYLYAGLAILCWSSVSTAFKLSLRYLSPLGLTLFSSVSAMFFLGLVILLSPGFSLVRNPRRHFLRNIIRSIPSGILNPFLYYLILFEAYNRLRAQEAQVLNYTWAIALSFQAAIILVQKIRYKDIIALLISFIGVIIIATRGRIASLMFEDLWGTILAVGSSVIWATYWLINMKDTRELKSRLFFNFLAGCFFIGLYILVCYFWKGPVSLFVSNQFHLIPVVTGAIYIGIFEMGLTFLLWNKALSSSDNTSKVANLVFITPFISLIFIAIVLKEPISAATIAGLILIVISNLYQKTGS
ncbi:MAG: DMT family transporter [Candidatus Cloacimonadaceae bacterium]|nr:DMT family transporter [Candidatus Cloacimonadaceae bacterium]